MDTSAQIQKVAELVRQGNVVALTGAGVSTESGIPDFRSPGGLWERFDPMDFAHIDSFRADPVRVWEMLAEFRSMVVNAAPNRSHDALVELEAMGLLEGVITQNVDGLHQRAGSKRVVEFHGNGDRLRCLICGVVYPRDEYLDAPIPPRCRDCESVLKPDIVFFGEMIPGVAVTGSQELVNSARSLLVCGTSAEVAPASQIPMIARSRGIPVIEFNLTETGLSCWVAKETVLGKVGQTLPSLVEAVRATG